jgi:hypothetical protein
VDFFAIACTPSLFELGLQSEGVSDIASVECPKIEICITDNDGKSVAGTESQFAQ